MATRDITTKVKIEGESEYKAALKNINSEYKVLESGLKTVTAEFQNNANSQAALTAKCDALQASLDNQKTKIETLKTAISSCEKAQDEWKSKMDETKTSLNDVNTKIDGLSESTRSSGEQWNKYEDQLNASKAELENLKNSTGDTTEEQTKLEAEITDLEGKMADLDESTGGTASETGALLREQESLGATLTEQEKKYDGVVNKTNNYQKQLNETETKAYNLDAELQKNKQYLDEAKNSTDHCATSIDQYGKEVKSTTSEVQENNNALQETSEAFDSMAAMLTTCGITKAIKEITAALEECVNVAADFEYTMATVQAVSGATADEMSQLEAQAKEYGSTTVFMAQDVADAYTAMGRAGWDAGQMLDGMQGVMNLASASGEDLGEVTSIVTDALTAFGYAADDAGHFADVLAETAAESNTTVSLLGDSFGTVATSAGTLGYSIDDVSIALGAMANAGIKGQEAGTQLATAFTRMSGSNETATKQLEDWNLSMFDANGSAKDLNTFLLELRQAFDDNCQSEEDMMNAAYNLAGQKGMRGLLAIVNTSEEDWDSLTDSIYNCEGAAQEMSDIQLDTYTGQVKLLQSAMEGLELEIGSQLTPVLGNLAEAFANIISHFTDFIASNEAVVPVMTGVTVALGAFAAAVTVGQVAVKGLTKAIQAMKGAAPIIGVISGIVGAVAAIATAASNSSAKLGEMQSALDDLQDVQATFSEDQNIIDLANQYYELSDKIENADLSEQELAETEQELEAVKKKLEEATDGQVSAEESSKTAYEETLAALLELIEVEQKRAAQETYNTLEEQSKEYQKAIEKQTDAEYAAAEAADTLAQAQATMAAASDPSALEPAYEALDNLRAIMFDSTSTAEDMNAGLREMEQTLYDITGIEFHFNSISDAEAAVSELGMSTEEAGRQAKDAEANYNYLSDELDEVTGIVDDYRDSVVQATMDGIVPMDEAAGWLGVTMDEMADMVDAATKAAEEEAKQAAETEAAIEAEREAAEAEAAAEEAAAQAQEEAAAALEAEAQAAAEAKKEMVDIGLAAIDARTSGNDLRSTYEDLSAQFEELKDDCDEATVELVEQQLALLDLAATTQELSTKYGDMTDLIGISTEQLAAWLIGAEMSVEDFAAEVDANTNDVINDFEKMSTDLEMSIQDMADNLAYNIQATADWSSNITELWNAAVQSGQDGATEFVQYLYEMGPEAATQVSAMCEDVEGTLSTFAPMFADAASTAVNETALGLAMENGEVYDAAADMIGNAEDAVEDEDLTESGEQKDTEIAAGITSNEKEVTSAMTDVCDATLQVWSSASSDFRSEGKNADTQIASGITSGQSSVTSAMSSVMAATKSEVSKVSWTSLGYNISSGIAQGIKNGSSLITSAAKSAANTALSSAKSALGVSSPSKVFRDEVGAMIPAGMAEGITDNMQMVTDAVTKMSSSTVPAVQTQSITNTYNTYGGSQYEEILMVLQEYLPYLPSLANMKVVLDSGATVGGLATQMDRKLGQFATYRARGN